MEILGKWGAWILAPQVIFGVLIYNIVDGYSFPTALVVAATWASVVMVCAALIYRDNIGVLVAMSSLFATSMLFTHVVAVLAIFSALCSIAFAFAAALIVRARRRLFRETLLYLTVCALPVGGALYLFDKANEKVGRWIGEGE